MSTIVWCDRARHIVRESRTEVEEAIADAANLCLGFVYFSPQETVETANGQVALRASAITSYQAMPGDGI